MGIMDDIECMRLTLHSTAKKHRYNFLHPEVLEASCKLDRLLNQAMKERRT